MTSKERFNHRADPNFRVFTGKHIHKGENEWFFFTRLGAESWRDGELHGLGEIEELKHDTNPVERPSI